MNIVNQTKFPLFPERPSHEALISRRAQQQRQAQNSQCTMSVVTTDLTQKVAQLAIGNAALPPPPAAPKKTEEEEKKGSSEHTFRMVYCPQGVVEQPDETISYLRGVLFRFLPYYSHAVPPATRPDTLNSTRAAQIMQIVLEYLCPKKGGLPREVMKSLDILERQGEYPARKAVIAEALSNRNMKKEFRDKLDAENAHLLPDQTWDFLRSIDLIGQNRATTGDGCCEFYQYVSRQITQLNYPLIVSYNGNVFLLFDHLALGAGTTKAVRLGLECTTGKWVAVAWIQSEYHANLEIEALRRVEKIQGCMKGICFVKYENIQKTMMTRIVMPLYPCGSLFNLMKQGLHEDDKISITLSLLRILNDSMRQGILIRDLKPENIFVRDGEIVIGDVGAACRIDDLKARSEHSASAWWCSPEIARAYLTPIRKGYEDVDLAAQAAKYREATTEKLVVWSLGCILYDLFKWDGKTGASVLPWAKDEHNAMLHLASLNNDAPPPRQPFTLGYLIWQMLRANPAERPNLGYLLSQATAIVRLQAKQQIL